jgi:Zn-dependent protease with chaperone function
MGVESILDEQGIGLDLNSLLVFAAVFGFGGSFISLAISKWTAKRFTGSIGGPWYQRWSGARYQTPFHDAFAAG